MPAGRLGGGIVAMGPIDELRQRLRTDPEFEQAVIDDPQGNLGSYALSSADLRSIADQLNDDPTLGPVEQRRRRARFFALFAERREDGPDEE